MSKIITGNKAKAKAKAKAKGTKKNGEPKVARMPKETKGRKVTVTATKKTGRVLKFQHMATGELELQYSDKVFGNVFTFSPVIGQRYQLQERSNGETVVCKFSPTGRKYRYVDTVRGSAKIAVKKIKAGQYRKIFF